MSLFNPIKEISTIERIERVFGNYTSIPTTEYWISSFVVDISEIIYLNKEVQNKIVIAIRNELALIFENQNIVIIENNILISKKVYSLQDLYNFFKNISFSMNFFYILKDKILNDYNFTCHFGFATALSFGNEFNINNQNYFLQFTHAESSTALLAKLNLSKNKENSIQNRFAVFLENRFYENLKEVLTQEDFDIYEFERLENEGIYFTKLSIDI